MAGDLLTRLKAMPRFRELYCTRYHCAAEGFEEHLTSRFLFRRAKLLKSVITRFNPNYFCVEHDLARALGRQTDLVGFQLEIDLYHAKSVEFSFPRRWLGLRLRCRRLTSLGSLLLPERTPPPTPIEPRANDLKEQHPIT